MSRALVIAAHGSRRDPAANALVRRLAEAVRARRLFDEVAVAFHQGEPRFDSVLDELTSDEVTVVPLLTSAGHYTDVVLPRALAENRRFAEVRLRQTPPVGTHSSIASLVARRVTELLRDKCLDRHDVSLALVGHGTRRHPESRSATLALAETLRRRKVAGEVLAAFLDDDPPLETLTASATLQHLVVVPFLVGGSAHVVEDIPSRLVTRDYPAHEARALATDDCRLATIDHPIGHYPGIADIIVDLARRHPPAPSPRFRYRGIRASQRQAHGAVYLVGAGPGDPGLITSKGLGLLRDAQVVIHDRLIGSELLSETRTDAVLIDVGKGPGHAAYLQAEINELLVEHAQKGRMVVRLKGGDPFVFGRGSEEVEACRKAGIQVGVVPGISSAIAGPAAAGIPVTARGIARSFAVVTGHTADDGEPSALSASSADTLVFLMARARLASLAAQLIAEGRDPATPAACIQSATTPEERITVATLATIAEAVDRDGLEAPLVTVIGEVVRFAREGGEAGTVRRILSEDAETRGGGIELELLATRSPPKLGTPMPNYAMS
jgi:uroporphyrin-III C-methyltransferase